MLQQSRKVEGSSAKGKVKKDGALVWAVPPELENFNVGCCTLSCDAAGSAQQLQQARFASCAIPSCMQCVCPCSS